jgi:hypothetical protein
MKLFEQGLGMRLAIDPTFVRWLASDVLLELIQCANSLDRLGVEGIRPRRMKLVELSSRVRPTGRFGNAPRFVYRLIAAVGVGLQRAGKGLQMLLRMNAFAVRRVGKPSSGPSQRTRTPPPSTAMTDGCFVSAEICTGRQRFSVAYLSMRHTWQGTQRIGGKRR